MVCGGTAVLFYDMYEGEDDDERVDGHDLGWGGAGKDQKRLRLSANRTRNSK